MPETPKPTGLALLREPFPPHLISKLPKPTKAQTDAVRADFKKGIRCELCGAWHHPDVVHLDYVGHAALTDRLLDADPEWNWTPFALDQRGLPAFDQDGGMWINLTVCGVTRPGYGHADGKTGGNAIKEAIGDAMRNAAMRFGAALDLWHKGDLHAEEGDGNAVAAAPPKSAAVVNDSEWMIVTDLIEKTGTDAKAFCKAFKIASVKQLAATDFDKARGMLNKKLAAMAPPAAQGFDVSEDEVAY